MMSPIADSASMSSPSEALASERSNRNPDGAKRNPGNRRKWGIVS
jgi:hypothetical protein